MAMIGGSERTADRAIWLALLTFLVALALAVRSLAPPEPLPIDAPPDKFSGLRALETLRYLLGDETPHPVGSAANQAVRDRLIETLRGLGVEPEVQRTIGCSGASVRGMYRLKTAAST